MAQPTFMGDGSTPRMTDRQLTVWKKILGAIQNGLGGAANAANNPNMNDTLYQTKQKVLKARQ